MSDPTEARRRQTLASLSQHLHELPVLPTTVVRLLSLDAKSEGYFDEVARLVETDPSFTTHLLAHANSVVVAGRTPTTRIRDAVVRLGPRQVVNLIFAASATAVFVPREAWQKGLWLHAMTTASVVRHLAALAPTRSVDPDELYLAGLLHDLGRFVLYLEAPEELRAVDETEWETPRALIEAELRICGFTHAELGYQAAVKWQLPAELATFIRYHHETLPAGGSPRVAALVSSVRIADWASVSLLKATDWSAMSTEQTRSLLARAPVPPAFWTDKVVAGVRNGMAEGVRSAASLGV